MAIGLALDLRSRFVSYGLFLTSTGSIPRLYAFVGNQYSVGKCKIVDVHSEEDIVNAVKVRLLNEGRVRAMGYNISN